ncbi:MAG: 50S ribosomal protein L28 [Armatimonadetes bacterium]|nr:50S ribosomal protein L28 [Armatimonadota bacterium]
MSQRCAVCGKGPTVGMYVPHSQRRTKRRFMPNLQRIRVVAGGAVVKQLVCTSCIKSNKVARPG